MRKLLERRVPQIVGLYLAGSWGFVQFVDWAVHQYALSPDIVNFVVTLLLLLLPSVAWLAWRHGAPGKDRWGAKDGGVIFANLVAAAGVLVLAFAGRELGAATTLKLVEDDEGNVVERAVPKAAFRRALLGFRFENASGDPDLDWLRRGFDLAISFDIGQDPFVRYTLETHPFVEDLLGEAGIGPGADVPITLRRRAAETLDVEHFLEGTFRTDGDALEVTTRLYETRNARPAAEHVYRGTDPLAIVDRITVDLRTDLGIPDWQIEEAVDLPAAELLTGDSAAFRALAEADGAMAARDLQGALASAERAAALDSTSAVAHLLAGWMSFVAGDLAAGRRHMDAMARFEWRLPERTRLAMRAEDALFFRQDPEAALRTTGYWAEVYPEDPEAWKTLALVHLQGFNREEAIPHLRALLAIDPTDPDGTRWLAEAYSGTGQLDSALAVRRRRAERIPSDMENRLGIADILTYQGNLAGAREELEAARLSAPRDFDVLEAVGRLDLREGHVAEAARIAAEGHAIARSDDDRFELAGFEESVAYARGQVAPLEEAYRRRLRLSRGVLAPVDLPWQAANSELLFAAAEWGREAWALRQLDSIAAPVDPPWSYQVASASIRIHLDRGDAEAARAAARDLAQFRDAMGGGNWEAFILWAEARADAIEAGSCAGSLDRYDEARAFRPLSQMFALARARCLRELGRLDEAGEEMDWLLARWPGVQEIQVEAARLAAARGDKSEALGHLDAALATWAEADPDYRPAEEARALRAELATDR
jgi:Flp pilus assembly protein TadD